MYLSFRVSVEGHFKRRQKGRPLEQFQSMVEADYKRMGMEFRTGGVNSDEILESYMDPISSP